MTDGAREAELLSRYLTGAPASPSVARAYARWRETAAVPAPITAYERWLTGFALRGPTALRWVDAWTSWRARNHEVRHLLNAFLAIAECDGQTVRRLNPETESPWINRLRLAGCVVRFGGILALASVGLPLAYLCNSAYRSRRGENALTPQSRS
ncbi:hypothetical protein KF840_08655 [bacterium]|nr:hypothetical protein [bacterium]